MKVANIDRMLLFRNEEGEELTQGQLTMRYGFEPDGSNLYYGFNSINLDHFTSTGRALNPGHVGFFDDIQASFGVGGQLEKTVVLGVEPSAPDTFDFVAANMGMARALARELNDQQSEARERGRQLRIVIRYASEMNDRPFNSATQSGNPWGGRPDDFKPSFRDVRAVFHEEAPEIRFAFSPAIRADLDEAKITDFWPGSDAVDVIAGTWYVHAEEQFNDATHNMRAYFLHRLGAGKPFAFDELGGASASNQENDRFLQRMLNEVIALRVIALREQGIAFDYATLFLSFPFGEDATLDFLTAPV